MFADNLYGPLSQAGLALLAVLHDGGLSPKMKVHELMEKLLPLKDSSLVVMAGSITVDLEVVDLHAEEPRTGTVAVVIFWNDPYLMVALEGEYKQRLNEAGIGVAREVKGIRVSSSIIPTWNWRDVGIGNWRPFAPKD